MARKDPKGLSAAHKPSWVRFLYNSRYSVLRREPMRVGGFGMPEMIVLAIVVVVIIAVARNFKKGGLAGGAFVGALLGFLFRPSVPFVGQLPLGHVITRGAYLNGVDVLLRSS